MSPLPQGGRTWCQEDPHSLQFFPQEKGRACEWVPASPSCARCCPRGPLPSCLTQVTEVICEAVQLGEVGSTGTQLCPFDVLGIYQRDTASRFFLPTDLWILSKRPTMRHWECLILTGSWEPSTLCASPLYSQPPHGWFPAWAPMDSES